MAHFVSIQSNKTLFFPAWHGIRIHAFSMRVLVLAHCPTKPCCLRLRCFHLYTM